MIHRSFLASILLGTTLSSAPGPSPAEHVDPVFREPFVLRLHVDNDHYYEERFEKVPYVYEGGVYLFKGERFGVALDILENEVRGVTYEPEAGKADVVFEFSQETKPDGTAMMVLVIENRTKHTIGLEALMTVPDRKQPMSTSILPVRAGLTNYESWPHPIVQLLIHGFKVRT